MKQPTALEQKVTALVEPLLPEYNAALVSISVRTGGKGHVQVLVEDADPAKNIPLDTCTAISRSISAQLDVEDIIPGRYELEVSSAGVERPLTKMEDFERFSGRQGKIKLFAPIDGKKTFEGLVGGTEDGYVILNIGGTPVHFDPEAISNAHLTLSDTEWKKLFKQNENQ